MAAQDTSVKNYRSTDAGAPVLSGSAGSLIAVLDVLVNGYNLLTATSVVVANGIATATYATAHGYRAGVVLAYAGAAPAALNGEKRIISATTFALTFDATGVADGTATGTITSKMAGAGFAKVFSGTNEAVYKSSAIAARNAYIRVVDTGALTARITGYESMADVATGTGLTPSAALLSGGFYWPKSSAASATAVPWQLFTDGRTVYLYCAWHLSYQNQGWLCGFGDLAAQRSNDAYAWFVSGSDQAAASVDAHLGVAPLLSTSPTISHGCAVLRSYNGLGGAVLTKRYVFGVSAAGLIGGSAAKLIYPNGPDNALLVDALRCMQGSHLRGAFPGLYGSPQNLVAGGISHGDVFNVGAKTLVALATGDPGYDSFGFMFVDISGPWQ